MKTVFLQIRISPQIKDALAERARLLGMSASEYVRTLIMEDIRRPYSGKEEV